MADLSASCPTPEAWAPQPPERPQGDGGTSCSSTAPPLQIDVAALSVGLPDGVYYAGKRLTPWMSFKDRHKAASLDYDRRNRSLRREDLPVLQALSAALASESVVVRWEIDCGIPSAPTSLRNPYGDGRDGNPNGGLVKAFIWGKDCDHTDKYELGWELPADALGPCHNSRPGKDDLNTAMHALTDTFGDEWVLPARQIRQIAARCDLLAVAERFEEAKQAALDDGLDADAILAEAASS